MMKKVLIQLSAALCLLMTSAALSAQTVEESQVTLLDYISSTGAQAFNTGYTHKANTRVEMDCYVVRNSMRTWEALLGARLGSYQSNAFCFFSRTDGADVPCFNRSGNEPRGSGFVYNERIRLVCEGQTATWYRQSAPDTPAGSVTTTGTADDGKTPMLLFNLNTSSTQGEVTPDGSPSIMTLYSCKIYEGSTLICDFVPAKYNGTVGLYDRVNKTFSGSITDTPFEETNEKRENYDRALPTIVDEQNYRVFTMYGGQKYYVTASGYLSTNVLEAPAFFFHKARGEEFAYGFMIRNGFFNFTNPEEKNDAALTKGHLNVTNENARHTWEAQVFFLNSEGKYAIRTTNALSGTSGWNKVGSAFWTVNAGASGPLAEYSYDMNYVWQLEEAPSNAPTPDEELLVNGTCDGTYNGWTKTDGGNGWEIRTEDGRMIWASSFNLCTLTQTVTLADHNISNEDVDEGNVWVTASAEMKSKTFKNGLGANECKIIVTMLDADGQTLGTVKLIDDQTYYPDWDTYRTVPFQLASGTRSLKYYVSGQDAINWAGRYGPCFANLSLKAIVDDGTTGERYPVWVGSTRVTSANMNDVLGDGSVSYTPGEGAGTLTFNNSTPNIAGEYSWTRGSDNLASKIYAKGIELTINTPADGLTIETANGDGTSYLPYGIYMDDGDLVVNGNLNMTADYAFLSDKGSLTINGDFNLLCRKVGLYLTEGDLSISGDVYIKSPSINPVISLVNGHLTPGPGNWEIDANGSALTAALPDGKGGLAIPETHEVILPDKAYISDDNRALLVRIDENSSAFAKHVKIWKKSELYPVWVGETRVTIHNLDDVLGDGYGDVRYTPGEGSGTLTFTNQKPSISSVHKWFKGSSDYASLICARGIDLTINAPTTLTLNTTEGDAFWVVDEGSLTVNTNLKITAGRAFFLEKGDLNVNGDLNATCSVSGFSIREGDANISGNVYIKSTSINTVIYLNKGHITTGPGDWQIEANGSAIHAEAGNVGGLFIPYTHRITYPEGAKYSDDYRGLFTADNQFVKNLTIEQVGRPTVIDLSTLTADCVAQDNTLLTGTMSGFYKVSIADGAIVTLRNATISKQPESGDEETMNFWDTNYRWAGITCEGNATILLEGENTVKGFSNEFPGIYVPVDKTLDIDGTGKLNATGGGIPGHDSYSTMSAGIGGGYDLSCGNIRIHGGDITATSEYSSAGIGGGMADNSDARCGTITIYGGKITATGGLYAAGIGSGLAENREASCSHITIYDGDITATGGYYGAGIGSGLAYIGKASCGNISIHDGKVTAVGGEGGAGIGSGPGINNQSSCRYISIYGGTVTATGGTYSSGIGSGMGDSNQSLCEIIRIDNGTVTATGGANGAGIGSGVGYNGPSSCGNVIINGGVVNAAGIQGGAGIGSGVAGNAESHCGIISISGGMVTAIGDYSPGIGSGYANASKSTCYDILIQGGTVSATGGKYSAGIGTGYKNEDEAESSCGDIIISYEITRVTATAGLVEDPSQQSTEPIGVGYNGICNGTITISPFLADIVIGSTRTLFVGTTGDVNGDGEVNVSDVTMLVSMILGNTPQANTADVNGDGEVNVSDVTALVSIILGQ